MVRRFPVVLEMLADGAVNLTTVKLLSRHLTPANHRALLESARGLGRRAVERIVATLAPQPDVPTSIRKLPPPATATPARLTTTAPLPETPAAAPASEPPSFVASTTAAPPAPSRALVGPLSPDRYKLQLTIDGDTLEKLELARDLLRHALPSGDHAAILNRALTALIADLMKKKFAITDRPRRPSEAAADAATTAPAPSRYVPADVRRAVFLRDGGRCAYVGPERGRCDERAFIEIHHLHPHTHDGPTTVDNLELRCRLCRARHNRHYADCRIMPTDLRWVAMGAVEGRTRAA